MTEPSYAPTDWVNDATPALSKDNLNKLEQAMKAATDRAAVSIRSDVAQTLTPAQQAIARANAGAEAAGVAQAYSDAKALTGIVATQTADFVAVAGKTNPVDATAGPVTATLPATPGEGARIVLQKIDASANSVTLGGPISGGGYLLAGQRSAVELLADDAGLWWPISSLDGAADLGSAFTPRLDLVSQLQAPFYIAHRGGKALHPEHSMEGYRASAAAGFLPEQDLHALADGTLVCLHDDTVDRTMTGVTGNVSALTLDQWLSARLDPVYVGGRTAMPVLWDQVLGEFGGRVILVPEIKLDDDTLTTNIINSIVSRGLQGCVIVQSFYFARAQAAAEAGCQAMLLLSDTTTTAATITAAGIQWVGIENTVVDANPDYLAGLIAAGLKATVWTVDEKSQVDGYLAQGCAAVFTNDPWRASRRFAPGVEVDFASGFLWPLATQYNNGLGITMSLLPADSLIRWVSSATSAQASWRLGELGDGPMNGTYRFGLQFQPVAAGQLRWFGVWIGHLPNDSPFKDGGDATTGPAGYHFLIRRSGELDIYIRNSATTATEIATVAGTALTADANSASALLDFEITIDAGNLTLKCLTNGTQVTIADASVRPDDSAISVMGTGTSVDLTYFRVSR